MRKTTKKQSFSYYGETLTYRISEYTIRRYEQRSGIRITAYMTTQQTVRALYHATCNLPAGVTEDDFVKAFKSGRLYTRSSRREYSVRSMRSLFAKARQKLITESIADITQ